MGVLFRCCRVYQRLYLNADGSAFAGRCPRCGARVTLLVDPHGTDSRFFEVGG